MTTAVSPHKTLADIYLYETPIVFKKGEVIVRADSDKQEVFIIQSGFVRVYSISEGGCERLHVILKQGDLFPLCWFIHQNLEYYHYEAMTLLEVKKIKKDDFLSFVKENPELNLESTNKMSEVVEMLSNRIETLTYTNSYSRLISFLIFLCKRFGEGDGEKLINVPLVMKDISDSISMTRETACRFFHKLKKKGIVSCNEHHIVIKDFERLANELVSSCVSLLLLLL